MRFTAILAAAAAGFSALATAFASASTTDLANPIYAPVSNTTVKAGDRFTIEWLPTAGKKVTLVLCKGTNEKKLDTLEVIASDLPNTGAFIWVPSMDLLGATDYSIQITSDEPKTENFSARFKIDSKGKGISGTTIVPSTTRSVTASATLSTVPTYTGTAMTTDGASATGSSDQPSASYVGNAGVTIVGSASVFKSLAAVVAGMMAGGLLML